MEKPVLINLDSQTNLVDKDHILIGNNYFKPEIAAEIPGRAKKQTKMPERDFPQLKKDLHEINERYE